MRVRAVVSSRVGLACSHGMVMRVWMLLLQGEVLVSYPGVQGTIEYELAGFLLQATSRRGEESKGEETWTDDGLTRALEHANACVALNPNKSKHWWRKHGVQVKMNDIQGAISTLVDMGECVPESKAQAMQHLDVIKAAALADRAADTDTSGGAVAIQGGGSEGE